MFRKYEKLLPVFVGCTAIFLFPVMTLVCADRTSAAASGSPKVLAIQQVTHDGVNKANLLSDGSNLYISESTGTQHLLAKVSLQNSVRAVLPVQLPNVQALDISPDHKSILVSAMQSNINQLWTLPLGPGLPSRLGDLSARDATWSATGKTVAFVKDSTLYTANGDGSSARELLKGKGPVFAPRFSPDGKRIRFSVADAGASTTTIWEINDDGANPHALLKEWQNETAACCGNWTADGRYYIFQVTQGTLTTLWALSDAASAAPVQLTEGPTSFGNAALSADNKNIWAIGVQPAAEAVVYKAGKLNRVLGGVSATDVDFSADGKWATYVSIPERELWRCRADGSGKLKLTSAPEQAALPRWSPDGNQIAYVRLLPGQPTKITLVPRDGGPARDLLDESRSQIDANWSADGKQMMIGSFNHDKETNIRLLDLQTKRVEVLPGSDGIFSPRWSPDGKYVAALSTDSTKVLLFDFASQKWSAWLSEPAGAVSYPVWSGDGKSLYFDDLVTGVETIRRANLGRSETETAFTLPNFDRFPGPFGLWSGRTSDGSWMFVRDRSTQEVYQLAVSLP